MALTRVDTGFPYFPQFSNDRAIAGAQIYIGQPGLDPQVLTNQIQAYIVQENGTQVPVSQPIATGAGGVPIYNGSPAQIGVNAASYSLKVLNSFGSQIYYIPDSADMAGFTTNATAVQYDPPGTGVFPTTVAEELNRGYVNALRFSGVVADKVTDCYTGLMAAISSAFVLKTALYLPSAPPGFYYRINQGLVIQNKKDFVLFGDGVQSLIVNFNNAGQNAITVDASTHVRIRNIGITGVIGSGNGLEFINSSHKYLVENVWAGWNDGDGSFVVTRAISGRFIGCSVDENNGYDPAGLGILRGNSKRAWWIKSEPSGLNNDTNLTSCVIDGGGAGGNYSLQVGTPGGDQVESFKYQGLIQASERLVRFAAARDAHIVDTHIEPPVGALADYVVRIEDSLNCTINGRNIQGDVLIRNSVMSGLKNLRTGGINIETDCVDCFVNEVRYGNIITGPIGGKLIDQSLTSRITDTTNSSNERYSIGSSLKWSRTRYHGNNMQQIVLSGGLPVVPCGFEKTGAYTSTLSAGISPYGAQAFQVNHTADFTQGFSIRLAPISQIRGRKVLVDALLLNQLLAGGGYILMDVIGGASAGRNGQESFQINNTERLQVTFNVPVDATAVDIFFTGVNGARVNWINIDIDVEGVTTTSEDNAGSAATATPDISVNDGSNRGGYQLKVAVVGAGSNITDFLNPHVGQPFTLRFTAGRTVVNSATLRLAGGANFVATAEDMLTLEYGADGVFREVARSVN